MKMRIARSSRAVIPRSPRIAGRMKRRPTAQPPHWTRRTRAWASGVVLLGIATGISGSISGTIHDAISAAISGVSSLFTGGSPQSADSKQDLWASTDIVALADEGSSVAFPGVYSPSPAFQRLMSQPGSAALPQFKSGLDAAGGIKLDALSIRLVLQRTHDQSINILDIHPVSLRRTAPLNGTLFAVPAQGGSPTMKMAINLDEVNPIARVVGAYGQPGDSFFENETITLNDNTQQIIVIRLTTARFNVAFDLAIDYLVGTDRKEIVVDDHGKPFRVTAEPCDPATGLEIYRRVYALQGDLSVKEEDPDFINKDVPACTERGATR